MTACLAGRLFSLTKNADKSNIVEGGQSLEWERVMRNCKEHEPGSKSGDRDDARPDGVSGGRG